MASALSKWTALRHELGTGPALLYLFQKLWRRLGGKLVAYRFAYQPIPDQRSVAPAVGVEFRWLKAFEHSLMVEDRKEAIVRARFDRGDRCLAAFKAGELAAFLWLANTHYPEDDARCDYRLNARELVWDYDVYVAPKYRVTRLFAQLWDEANAALYRDGARWSVSRISAFNAASLRSHQKRGARLTGSAFFIMRGRLQLVLASQRPRLHLSLSRRPEFRFDTPPNLAKYDRMLKTALISASVAGLSYLYTDVANESAWKSAVLPAIMVISLIVLALAVVQLIHRANVNQTGTSSGDFSNFD